MGYSMKRLRVTTRLSPVEVRDFKRVKKFVESYSGEKVSRAEVLRYLVRNWSEGPKSYD